MTATIIGLLAGVGRGLFSYFGKRKKDKQNANKMQALLKNLEENNPQKYILELEKFYKGQRADTRRDMQRIFRTQSENLKTFIQQRRIPEYLAGVQKLSKAQAEAINKAMRTIDLAETTGKLEASKQAISTAFGMAQTVPMLESIYGAKGDFGKTLRTSLQPISDYLSKTTNQSLINWFETLKSKAPSESITEGFGTGGGTIGGFGTQAPKEPFEEITSAFTGVS